MSKEQMEEIKVIYNIALSLSALFGCGIVRLDVQGNFVDSRYRGYLTLENGNEYELMSTGQIKEMRE